MLGGQSHRHLPLHPRRRCRTCCSVGFGRIVNIASIAGLRGAAYISAYARSKHAVIGLTRSLALEFASRNITVNAVCPGLRDTDIVRDAIANIRAKTGRSDSEALRSAGRHQSAAPADRAARRSPTP